MYISNLQISLNVNKTIFWIVLAVAATSVILTTQIIADAQNEEIREWLSIEELRQISLAEGKIFDDYLIPFEMAPAVIEHFGGEDQALKSYTHLTDLLDYSRGDPHLEKRNGLLIPTWNFSVITNSTELHDEEISALVIHEQKLAGTYVKPELEPLQRLHTYFEEEYPINIATPSLQDVFGYMSVLAPEILEIEETAALLGPAPEKLTMANPDYWGDVYWYGSCKIVENRTDCDMYLENIQTKEPWEGVSIDELRRISIEEGRIFDDYLIPYEMSPVVIEYFGGLDQTRWSHNHFNDMLEKSIGSVGMEKRNGLVKTSWNFNVMTNSLHPHDEEIAAMVIHEQKLAGTYQQPDLEPLQKLHTYLEEEYQINTSTPSLQDIFGDMIVLTPQILENEETSTLLGKPPYLVRGDDRIYWSYIQSYGYCEIIKNLTGCDKYLEKAKAWEQRTKEEAGSPEEMAQNIADGITTYIEKETDPEEIERLEKRLEGISTFREGVKTAKQKSVDPNEKHSDLLVHIMLLERKLHERIVYGYAWEQTPEEEVEAANERVQEMIDTAKALIAEETDPEEIERLKETIESGLISKEITEITILLSRATDDEKEELFERLEEVNRIMEARADEQSQEEEMEAANEHVQKSIDEINSAIEKETDPAEIEKLKKALEGGLAFKEVLEIGAQLEMATDEEQKKELLAQLEDAEEKMRELAGDRSAYTVVIPDHVKYNNSTYNHTDTPPIRDEPSWELDCPFFLKWSADWQACTVQWNTFYGLFIILVVIGVIVAATLVVLWKIYRHKTRTQTKS